MEELLRAAHIFQKIIGSTMIIITRAETNHQNIFKMESDQTKVALVSLDKLISIVFGSSKDRPR